MEKFLDLAYRRDSEAPRAWPFRSLTCTSAAGLSPVQKQTVTAYAAPVGPPLGAVATALSPPFYPASQFTLHGRTPLPWPEQEPRPSPPKSTASTPHLSSRRQPRASPTPPPRA